MGGAWFGKVNKGGEGGRERARHPFSAATVVSVTQLVLSKEESVAADGIPM